MYIMEDRCQKKASRGLQQIYYTITCCPNTFRRYVHKGEKIKFVLLLTISENIFRPNNSKKILYALQYMNRNEVLHSKINKNKPRVKFNFTFKRDMIEYP